VFRVFIVAQLSDFHVRAPGRTAYGVETNAMFERSIDAVLRMDPRPDCVIVSGDLTDCGLDEEYEVVVAGLRRLPMPVHVIPGNHDLRGPFVKALSRLCGELPAEGFVHYAVDRYPVRLIALDSVVEGETGGRFCHDQQEWLRAELARGNGRPTLIMIHHPPFSVAVNGMDTLGLENARALERIVRDHPEIERVVCGHYHRPITVRFGGTVGFAAPSVAHQVALDLRPGTSNRFIMEPPAFAVHVWRSDSGIVTHLMPIGDYGAPFDIVLAPEYPGLKSHA
jgi:3',5'-cyclic AMP phosphodiesterase CpdA